MDEKLKRISELDQLTASLETISTVLGSYFRHLKKAKFSREEAFKLVCSYQDTFINLIYRQLLLNGIDNNLNNNKNNHGFDKGNEGKDGNFTD